jgi:hypothetical protein
MNIADWAVNFGIVSELIIVSIILYQFSYENQRGSGPKLIVIYLLLSVASDVSTWKINTSRTFEIVQGIFTTSEWIIFSVFLVRSMRLEISKKTFALPLLFSLIFFTNLFGLSRYKNFNSFVLYEAIVVTFLCLLYYKRLFEMEGGQNLLLRFDYWIVMGLFFYFGGTIPLYFYRSITYHPKYDELLQIIAILLHFIMLFTFIRAFKCLRKS